MVFFSVLTVTYGLLFLYQFDAPISQNSEYWLHMQQTIKTHFAETIKEPKIIISGGSNGLFGIDSPKVASITNRPVVNLSTHQSFSFDHHVQQVEKVARAGDIVIFPLEWEYYFSEPFQFGEWQIAQTIRWDKEYFYNLNLRQKLAFITSLDIKTFYNNLIAKLNRETIWKKTPLLKSMDKEEVIANYYKTWDLSKVSPYWYLNDNKYGDVVNNCTETNLPVLDTATYGLNYTRKVNPRAVQLMLDSIDKFKKMNVQVYFVPPAFVKNSYTSTDAVEKNVGLLINNLKTAGLPFIGEPSNFQFEKKDFFDTIYHLNCRAKLVRSERLGDTIIKEVAMNNNIENVG